MRGEPVLPCPKPARGTLVLAREQERAEALALERQEKGKAKKRDGRCRWPEKHVCRCGLEAAHIVDASLGGLMESANLVTLCGFLHRRGPQSLHGKQLKVLKESSEGANGPLSFWRQAEDGTYYLVAREVAPFVLERD